MKINRMATALFATLSLSALSCDDDKLIGENELPKTAHQFLSDHFNGANVLRVEKDSKSYSAHLSTRIEVEFDRQGEWQEVDGEDGVSIPTGYIIPQIVAYVEANYPNNPINGIEKKANGFDVDLIMQDIDLYFDAEGKFQRVDP